MNDLELRVQKLEQSHNRLKLVSGILFVFALFGFRTIFMGGIPEEVNAQHFIIRSADGVSMGAIEASGISFYSRSGKISTRLIPEGDNAGLFIDGTKLGDANPKIITTSTVSP